MIESGAPRIGDLVICDEPFDCTTDYASITSLVRVLSGLDLRVHHLWSLPKGTAPWRGTLLLHGSGLLQTAEENPQAIAALAEISAASQAHGIAKRRGLVLKAMMQQLGEEGGV